MTATTAMALAAGADAEQAARLAGCASAVVVGRLGTAPITLAELADAASTPSSMRCAKWFDNSVRSTVAVQGTGAAKGTADHYFGVARDINWLSSTNFFQTS